MRPTLIKGNAHHDHRGTLRFNNAFDLLPVKRLYTIENANVDLIRGWQGHKAEQRWFSAVSGAFVIRLIQPDDWENPSKDLCAQDFMLHADTLDILHVPAGYISSIQALEADSKLLVLADYRLGEIDDEYRYSLDYFIT